MPRRRMSLVLAMTMLAACASQSGVATVPTSTPPRADLAPPTVTARPSPSAVPEPLTITATDVVDEPATAAEDWAFTLRGASLLVANEQGVWQIDRATDDAELIIPGAAVRAFDDGEGTVAYQTLDGTIRARRGDSPDRVVAEPAPGEHLTLATVAVHPDGGQALLVRRSGDDPVEELVAVNLDDGVERVLGEIGRGDVVTSSVSAHNSRVAVTQSGDGASRVSFLNLAGETLEFDGNPQPTLSETLEVLVADIDEERTFSWIERSGDGALRLVVGNYANGDAYREIALGNGWRPTHIANGGGNRWVVSRADEAGEPLPALLVLDREGALDEASLRGFTTSVNIQTGGPYRFLEHLERGLELWCQSDLMVTSEPDSFGVELVPLGTITSDDEAELERALLRFLYPSSDEADWPDTESIVLAPHDDGVILARLIGEDPSRVDVAIHLRRTVDDWAGTWLRACSGLD